MYVAIFLLLLLIVIMLIGIISFLIRLADAVQTILDVLTMPPKVTTRDDQS